MTTSYTVVFRDHGGTDSGVIADTGTHTAESFAKKTLNVASVIKSVAASVTATMGVDAADAAAMTAKAKPLTIVKYVPPRPQIVVDDLFRECFLCSTGYSRDVIYN